MTEPADNLVDTGTDTSFSDSEKNNESVKALKKEKTTASPKSSHKKKKLGGLDKLKKCVSLAGLRINNYKEFFSDCPNEKRCKNKIKRFLVEKGVKEPITMESCKKFKKSNEWQKELGDLDQNLILSESRSTRRSLKK